jgi:hypothetical protein
LLSSNSLSHSSPPSFAGKGHTENEGRSPASLKTIFMGEERGPVPQLKVNHEYNREFKPFRCVNRHQIIDRFPKVAIFSQHTPNRKRPPYFKTRENSKQKDCGKTVYALWKQGG